MVTTIFAFHVDNLMMRINETKGNISFFRLDLKPPKESTKKDNTEEVEMSEENGNGEVNAEISSKEEKEEKCEVKFL